MKVYISSIIFLCFLALGISENKVFADAENLNDKKSTNSIAQEKEKGKKFVEKFIKSGGKKTSSGLAYKIIKAGDSNKPKPTDTVEVHYHGTLIDGSVFDSSVDRNQKAQFPLNAVIRGWTEGLQLIGKGGEIELVIPSELAYGDRGAPPMIAPGATLVFKVQLF